MVILSDCSAAGVGRPRLRLRSVDLPPQGLPDPDQLRLLLRRPVKPHRRPGGDAAGSVPQYKFVGTITRKG